MDEANIKRKLRNELGLKMPSHKFNEIIKEINMNPNLTKQFLIDRIFDNYDFYEIFDLIYNKYMEKKSSSKKADNLKMNLIASGMDFGDVSEDNTTENDSKKDINKQLKELRSKEVRINTVNNVEKISKQKVEQKPLENTINQVREEKKELNQKPVPTNWKKNVEPIKKDNKRINGFVPIKRDKKGIKAFEEIKKLKNERDLIRDKTSGIDVYLSDDDVYFIHDYIPKNKSDEYYFENRVLSEDVKNKIQISKKLLKYKDGEDDAVNLFTKDIMAAISIISITSFKDFKGIALVSVPASKVDKPHQTTKSIEIIEYWFKNNEINFLYGCNKNIYNYSNLLKRYKSLESAHLSNKRPTVEDHLNSILCTEEDLSNLNYGFILLDDVSTQGNTMEACKKILMDKGLNEKQILPLVIGDTATKFLTLDKDGKEIILSRDFIFTL